MGTGPLGLFVPRRPLCLRDGPELARGLADGVAVSRGRKHVCIGGSAKTGALFALGDGQFIGTRMTARGKFEERTFTGKEWEAKRDWQAWRDETREQAFITPKREVAKVRKSEAAPMAHSMKCPYDLSAFTVFSSAHGRSLATTNDDGYVRFGKDKNESVTCTIVLSEALKEIVAEHYGQTVKVGVNRAARVLSIVPCDATDKDARVVSRSTKSGKQASISIKPYAAMLTDMFGEHRRVYFDADPYDEALILRPNGEVLD